MASCKQPYLMKSSGNSQTRNSSSCGRIQLIRGPTNCSILLTPSYNGQMINFSGHSGSWMTLSRFSFYETSVRNTNSSIHKFSERVYVTELLLNGWIDFDENFCVGSSEFENGLDLQFDPISQLVKKIII
ncbi:hypothetical protein TNCV_1071601 [Trichonephila clavipes]|nr:hypothetical protein TNCV_1071601 [Trichonephila clavipes]